MTRADLTSLRNMLSGVNTQLKRASAAGRRAELEARRARLLEQIADAPLEIEVAGIEARYAAAIAELAAALYGRPGDYRSETRYRNAVARKRARRGLDRLETVAEEMERHANETAARLLATRPELAAERAELERADHLRAELTLRAEQRAGIA